MKTKLSLLLFSLLTFSIVILLLNDQDDFEYPNRIGSNAISCTPAKFLLTDVDTTKQIAPLFENIGDHSYKVSTVNELAQKFFNQGLRLTYAFNHAEAARSFYYATKLDPKCAMAFWGFAYVLGPNYNAGMEPDNYERAYKAIEKATSINDAELASVAKEGMPNIPGMDMFK